MLARASTDAGKSFGPVARIDLGRPQGRVDGAMLADGTLVMTWLEATGAGTGTPDGIYLRTLSRDGRLSEPMLLAPSSATRMSGFPRLVSPGGRRLLLTCTRDTEPLRVLSLTVDLD